jgi:adenylate cyclase
MGKRRSHRLRLGLFLGVGLVAAAISLTADAGGILRSQELATADVRFSIRGSHGAPPNIVLVPIDDVTFSELPKRRWPFPRSLHAKVIDNLRRAGAKVIAFDVQFTEQTVPREDNALIEAVARAGNVVLATTEVDAHGHTAVLGGDALLRQIHAQAGNAVFRTDAGGIYRRFPYEIDGLKSFAVTVAERATGKRIAPSTLGGKTAWIDYAGPPGTVRGVSYSRVLRGKFNPSLFRGKIVIIGPAAPSLQDVHPTSVSGSELMSGAEIEANAVSTALRGFPLKSAPGYLNVLLIVLLALVAPLASLRLAAFGALGVAVATGALFAVAVQLAFNHGRVVSFVYPLVALAVSTVGSVAVRAVIAAFDHERIRDLFGRFVPDAVVDQVLAKTGDGLHLGGTLRVCTMMFTDLRGFTTFSEARPADEVIEILNYYFGEMCQAVLDHGGTLVSYLGDGMMACFGAPLDQEDHADRALAAAREMIHERLPRVNEWIREQGYGDGFRMGIGLNSGSIMTGNIGSERRMEYTTIGDAVNTCSRLEGLTKGTPYPLFISETTRALLREEPDDLVYVDELEVRGRSEKVKVYSLSGLVAPAPAPKPEAGLVAVAPAG